MPTELTKKYDELRIRLYWKIFSNIYFMYSIYPVYIILNFFRYLNYDISLKSFVFTKLLGKHIKIMGGVFIDAQSSLGDYSYIAGDNFGLNSSKINTTTIGRYCSIAQNFITLPSGHNYKRISTFPFTTISILNEKDTAPIKRIFINDGVWIGSNVIVLGGVTVGVGAVVGAGSIVTKDVSPYSIVAGNPAKEIKKRFSDKQIAKLIDLNPYENAEIIDALDFLSEDVEYFIEKYQFLSKKK